MLVPAAIRSSCLAAIVVAMQFAPTGSAQTSTADFAEHRVVVVVTPALASMPEQSSGGARVKSGDAELDALLERFGSRAVRKLIRQMDRPHRDPALLHALGLDRHFVIELAEDADTSEAIAAFGRLASIESARGDGVVSPSMTPNDPQFSWQWNLLSGSDIDIDADIAWDWANGGAGITVAVLDSGVEWTHPDLSSAIVPGYDFMDNDTTPDDPCGHGTSVCGIIGARANNNFGIAGIAYNCAIMPVKVLGLQPNCYGSFSWVASGIIWAVDHGARVINMSLGAYGYDSGTEGALIYAEQLGVLCIAAAGNQSNPTVHFPASSVHCMAIGAINWCGELKTPGSCDGEWWWGSAYGSDLDVVAPGVMIPATAIGGQITPAFNGTSSASPHVAGVAALVYGLDPTLPPCEVRDILRWSADDQVGPSWQDPPGVDPYFGYGRLNAYNAVMRTILGRAPQPTERVSTAPHERAPNGGSDGHAAVISDDGRFVAFVSQASNLVTGDTNNYLDVFAFDRWSQTTERVSIGPNGEQANDMEGGPAISADGLYVAFHGGAFGAIGSGLGNIWLRDRVAGTTRCISLKPDGTPTQNGANWPAISASGRFVSFWSYSNDLVLGDTNTTDDLFLQDRDSDADGIFDEPGAVTMERVNLGPNGVQSNGDPFRLSVTISTDGRYVVFDSSANNLIANDFNNYADVFVRDRSLGVTTRVSVATNGSPADASSIWPAMSRDGRFVTFMSFATNLASGVSGQYAQIYVIDRDVDQDGLCDEPGAIATSLVSKSTGGLAATAYCEEPFISADGRYVTFTSGDYFLAPGNRSYADVFLRDRQTSTTTCMSVDWFGATVPGPYGPSAQCKITPDGRYALFTARSGQIAFGGDALRGDVYVRDRATVGLPWTSFCECRCSEVSRCNNPTPGRGGCANSVGSGAWLSPSNSSSVVQDDLRLTVVGMPPLKQGLLFLGPTVSSGVLQGDGRRCVMAGSLGTARFPISISNASGVMSLGPGIAAQACSYMPSWACIGSGQTWYFQCWYRDASGPCTYGTNFSNAIGVTFTP